MKKIIVITTILLVGVIFQTSAQSIVLDKLVKAGDLTLFPDIYNEDEYYYIPDQVRVAKNNSGKPEFSFLRWVENESSSDAVEDSYKDTEGAGGGIVT